MSSENDLSISEAIKEKSSISEVAERFSISRPTLYRYMDYYSVFERERIPDNILEYFDFVCKENVTKDESKMFLINVNNAASNEIGAASSYNNKLRPPSFIYQPHVPYSWSSGELSTICVGEKGHAMVIFRGGLDHPDWTHVVVFIDEGDEDVLIGTYVPEPGMNFVNIDNLVSKLSYSYRVEQRSGEETICSETGMLVFR